METDSPLEDNKRANRAASEEESKETFYDAVEQIPEEPVKKDGVEKLVEEPAPQGNHRMTIGTKEPRRNPTTGTLVSQVPTPGPQVASSAPLIRKNVSQAQYLQQQLRLNNNNGKGSKIDAAVDNGTTGEKKNDSEIKNEDIPSNPNEEQRAIKDDGAPEEKGKAKKKEGDTATTKKKKKKKIEGDTPKKKRKKVKSAGDEEGPPNKKKKMVKKKKGEDGKGSPTKTTKKVKKKVAKKDGETTTAGTKTKKVKKSTTKKDGEATKKKTTKAKKSDETTTTKKKTAVKGKPTKAKSTTKKAETSKKKVTTDRKEPPTKRKKKDQPPRPPTPPPPPRSPSPPPSPPGPPPFEHAQDLLKQVEFALMGIQPDLDVAKEILEKHHQPTILAKEAKANNAAAAAANPNNNNNDPAPDPAVIPLPNTGGHSNTNHQVVLTGDPVLDKLREYQRHYQQRQRLLVPEGKGNNRWDKPKKIGERRRRIHREADRPEAPHEPPPVGFTVFVGQMTTKIRHDRIDQVHHQPTVMQEIAKLWKDDMAEADREYYNAFAREARAEYVRQQMEFRASGKYTPSEVYVKLGSGQNTAEQHACPGVSNTGAGPWIKKNPQERNALEQEISTYETVDFAPRPAYLNEKYQYNDWRSKLNRKLKLRKLIQDYHQPQEQAIVTNALNHAKHNLMDVADETIFTVDHSALLAQASHECVVKLAEMKRAIEAAKEPPPGDDPESFEAALRMMMFSEEDAYVEVETEDEEPSVDGEEEPAEGEENESSAAGGAAPSNENASAAASSETGDAVPPSMEGPLTITI